MRSLAKFPEPAFESRLATKRCPWSGVPARLAPTVTPAFRRSIPVVMMRRRAACATGEAPAMMAEARRALRHARTQCRSSATAARGAGAARRCAGAGEGTGEGNHNDGETGFADHRLPLPWGFLNARSGSVSCDPPRRFKRLPLLAGLECVPFLPQCCFGATDPCPKSRINFPQRNRPTIAMVRISEHNPAG